MSIAMAPPAVTDLYFNFRRGEKKEKKRKKGKGGGPTQKSLINLTVMINQVGKKNDQSRIVKPLNSEWTSDRFLEFVTNNHCSCRLFYIYEGEELTSGRIEFYFVKNFDKLIKSLFFENQ